MNQEKQKALLALKTAKGQIEGTIKMIEDERYCIDISNQISASSSLLKKANMLILRQHINNCVVSAVSNSEENATKKVEEIISVLSKLIDK